MDLQAVLRGVAVGELALIVGALVALTWLFTRRPLPEYVRELAFLHSARLTSAWYLVASGTALIGTGVAIGLFPETVPRAAGDGAPLLLLGGGVLLLGALVQVARTMTPYVRGLNPSPEHVEARLRAAVTGWLRTSPAEAARIYDLRRLREQPWRPHLTAGVSVRFHRSVLFATKRFLETKFGFYGAQALRETGRTVGLTVGGEWLGPGDEKALRADLFDVLAKEGVGVVRVTHEGPGVLALRVEECAECAGIEPDPGFACEFLGGFLAGLAERWWDAPVNAEETMCDGRGHPACEFTLARAAPTGIRVRTHGASAAAPSDLDPAPAQATAHRVAATKKARLGFGKTAAGPGRPSP